MTALVKHTPGPWTLTFADGANMGRPDYHVSGPGPNGSMYLGTWKAANTVAEQRSVIEANARLIAAAPDLLAACKQLIALHEAEDWPLENDVTMIEMARAAIAKAEGR